MTTFISTRGKSTSGFCEALLSGFCEDGGMFMPASMPSVSKEELRSWSTLTFGQLCFEVFRKFCPEEEIPHATLKGLLVDAFSAFGHADVIPVIPLEQGISLAEMFHGPTHAFKDIALQGMGRIVEWIMANKYPDKVALAIVCTTGDTGPAAVSALRSKDRVEVLVLCPVYPRIARCQEMQMISVRDENIHIIATSDGNGDDGDDAIRAIFSDPEELPGNGKIVSLNSINIGRIMFSMCHYFYVYFRSQPNCDEEIVVSVPSGAFGNACAGYLAKEMGLPVQLLFVNNENSVSHVMMQSGLYKPGEVIDSAAPAMDGQAPYNLERVFWLLNDKSDVSEWYKTINASGQLQLSEAHRQKMNEVYSSNVCSDVQVAATIAQCWKDNRYLVDPHTACGLYGAQQLETELRIVCLATAHPYKFSHSVEKATGVPVSPPFGLRFMLEMPSLEHVDYSEWNVTVVPKEQLTDELRKQLLECCQT